MLALCFIITYIENLVHFRYCPFKHDQNTIVPVEYSARFCYSQTVIVEWFSQVYSNNSRALRSSFLFLFYVYKLPTFIQDQSYLQPSNCFRTEGRHFSCMIVVTRSWIFLHTVSKLCWSAKKAAASSCITFMIDRSGSATA